MSLWHIPEDRLLDNPLYDRLLDAYYRLGDRGERMEDERRRQRLMDEYGFDLEAYSLQPLKKLLRVVPIGQEQRLEGGTLLVTTLEAYAEGAIVFVRLLVDETAEEAYSRDEDPDMPMPDLVLSVRDDRGRRYRTTQVMASSGGQVEYHWEFRILEALDPEARELTLTVAELEWRGVRPDIDHPLIGSGQTGPWTFRVPI